MKFIYWMSRYGYIIILREIGAEKRVSIHIKDPTVIIVWTNIWEWYLCSFYRLYPSYYQLQVSGIE